MASISTNAPKICANPACGKQDETAKMCGQCRLVFYCSPECQKTAWKAHKLVCQPPTKTQVLIYQGNNPKPTTIQSKVWSQEAIDAESATRNTHFLATGKLVPTPEEKKLPPEQEGLKNNPKKIARLLKEENYTELKKYLHTESDRSYQIEWLTRVANQGHVPLMFELVASLTKEFQESKARQNKTIEEAVKWFFLGMHCTQLDIACHDDPSLQGAPGMLSIPFSSLFNELLTDKQKKRCFNAEYKNQIIKNWSPSQDHPSPKWIAPMG